MWSENTFTRVAAKWGVLLDVDDKEDGCLHSKRICISTIISTNIFESFKVIYRGKVVWVRAKEVPGWVPDFVEDNEEENESDDESYEDEPNVGDLKNVENLESDSDGDVVSDNKFDEEPHIQNDAENSVGQNNVHSEDPFNLYEILNKKRDGTNKDLKFVDSLRYPLGFTPRDNKDDCGDHSYGGNENIEQNIVEEGHFKKSEMPSSGGSVLLLIDELIKGEVVIMGDFNEVRNKDERFGSVFNKQGADAFNSFISNAGLVEVPLGGCSFTWCHKSATKMSKLDRFLISDSLMCLCPNISSISLDRYLSDHRPILMREAFYDYGPVPFRFFHYWYEMEGFDKFVEDTWKEAPNTDSNALTKMMHKLKYLKDKIRIWNRSCKEKMNNRKRSLKTELAEFDLIIDKGEAGLILLIKEMRWLNYFKMWRRFTRWKWLKKRRLSGRLKAMRTQSIFMVFLTKREVRIIFVPHVNRLHIDMNFSNKTNSDQVAVLECEVSKEEIKRAVWDCGIDKSPGPDGFTFGFYRRYWNIIKNDVVDAILANSLVMVLGDLVNEVQYAFVADRQILDGPFILNELVQWCKKKKKNSLVFKIQNCLRSSRGLVIINGSPTKEFQFYKGLKQGDPLSPFLFILVMETLHISFQRVVDAGVFKVLECFHRASGLRINMSKSKLLGISVEANKVEQAAGKIGCTILKTPFSYLGSKLGGVMSRIHSWKETIESMVMRLSKWKLKTLSIGGRLTFLKSVLGSMLIYHMSIFKTLMKVLQCMNRSRFSMFKWCGPDCNKPIWVKWKNVLSPKDKGGLGVSSLFALNRALMFKWVWRFITQSSSLWARVIKALHGEDGKIGKKTKSCYSSIWLDIIQEVERFKSRGIDLVLLFKVLYPRLFALESQTKIDVASKLTQCGLDFSFRRAPRGGIEQNQFEMLKEKMKGCVLVNMQDRWFWSLEGSGDFSVAS
ncbi:RNA-directed DNA polymerase, eukaryota, reverse transcriptase zinc-binding domain protein [Tanacetum coccineum]